MRSMAESWEDSDSNSIKFQGQVPGGSSHRISLCHINRPYDTLAHTIKLRVIQHNFSCSLYSLVSNTLARCSGELGLLASHAPLCHVCECANYTSPAQLLEESVEPMSLSYRSSVLLCDTLMTTTAATRTISIAVDVYRDATVGSNSLIPI